jgi:anti-sigma factor RsiW
MDHDPELRAAAYLEGMSARERAEFEDHMLACEACWREVALARSGRALAECIGDRAPAHLRESIRAGIAAAAAGQPARTGRRSLTRALAAAAVVVAVMIGGIAVWRPWLHPGRFTTVPGLAVAQAVAGFRQGRLPGTTVPAEHAPDLSLLGLRLAGAAAGTIDGTPVTVFAYRSDTGRRLDVYRSARPIPETGEAHNLDSDERAWRSDIGGVTVICGPASHTVLLIGSDPSLVDQAGELLNVI